VGGGPSPFLITYRGELLLGVPLVPVHGPELRVEWLGLGLVVGGVTSTARLRRQRSSLSASASPWRRHRCRHRRARGTRATCEHTCEQLILASSLSPLSCRSLVAERAKSLRLLSSGLAARTMGPAFQLANRAGRAKKGGPCAPHSGPLPLEADCLIAISVAIFTNEAAPRDKAGRQADWQGRLAGGGRGRRRRHPLRNAVEIVKAARGLEAWRPGAEKTFLKVNRARRVVPRRRHHRHHRHRRHRRHRRHADDV
jgi:hypothetical protein